MLAIARALVQSPKLLLIDEMSMGLAPVAVESLMPVIRRVADEHGASVIMVEQHVQLALEVADEAIVLVHGSMVLSGPAEKLPQRHQRDRVRLHERIGLDELAAVGSRWSVQRRAPKPATFCAVDDTWVRWMPTLTGSVASSVPEPVPSWPLRLSPQAQSRPV